MINNYVITNILTQVGFKYLFDCILGFDSYNKLFYKDASHYKVIGNYENKLYTVSFSSDNTTLISTRTSTNQLDIKFEFKDFEFELGNYNHRFSDGLKVWNSSTADSEVVQKLGSIATPLILQSEYMEDIKEDEPNQGFIIDKVEINYSVDLSKFHDKDEVVKRLTTTDSRVQSNKLILYYEDNTTAEITLNYNDNLTCHDNVLRVRVLGTDGKLSKKVAYLGIGSLSDNIELIKDATADHSIIPSGSDYMIAWDISVISDIVDLYKSIRMQDTITLNESGYNIDKPKNIAELDEDFELNDDTYLEDEDDGD